MKRISLNTHGGGRLEIHGSMAARRIWVILGRENFRQDDALIARLINHFAGSGRTILRYESHAVVTTRLIDRKCFGYLPFFVRQGLKAILLLAFPARWRHYSSRYRAEQNSIAYRTHSLRELIRFLGPEKEVVLLTRSAGGRVATMIADQARLKKVVCLGYPFKHPDHAAEPERYIHLKNLQTPLLILQGKQDAYGDYATAGCYPLGRNTRIEWIDTDHGFNMSEVEWGRILNLIDTFI